MNWRDTQLGSDLCDQDRLILDLIGHDSVRICGDHNGFDRFCKVNNDSEFCLVFFCRAYWLSEIRTKLISFLHQDTTRLYVGINRYNIKGNDTVYKLSPGDHSPGTEILIWLKDFLETQDFSIKQQGSVEKDLGKHFNFIQPLTWVYAEHARNQGK